MEFAQIIEELGQKAGISDLKLDERGSCSLLFDDAHEVEFQLDREKGQVLIWCAVGRIGDLTEPIARLLLADSVFGAKTDGAAFGLFEPLDAIVLWQRLRWDIIDLDAFMDVLDKFLAQCGYWKEKIHAGEAGLETPSPEDVPNLSTAGMLFV